MNQPQIKPIHCQKCGKILLAPTEMGEYSVRCDACKIDWLVRVEINWNYYMRFNKGAEIKEN